MRSTYAPRHPVNLQQTLRPLGRGTLDPTLRWEGSAVWRTMNTADGAATLHLIARSAPAPHAVARMPSARALR